MVQADTSTSTRPQTGTAKSRSRHQYLQKEVKVIMIKLIFGSSYFTNVACPSIINL